MRSEAKWYANANGSRLDGFRRKSFLAFLLRLRSWWCPTNVVNVRCRRVVKGAGRTARQAKISYCSFRMLPVQIGTCEKRQSSVLAKIDIGTGQAGAHSWNQNAARLLSSDRLSGLQLLCAWIMSSLVQTGSAVPCKKDV